MTLYLCGFMGCGKSTVGKLLADKLRLGFTDLDDYIEEKENMSIPEIFSQKGEQYFRQAEAEAVKELAAEDMVVACGGGTIINDNSARIARENGTVIFFDIPFGICYDRIKDDSHRPLVVNNTKSELEKIFLTRHDIYMKNSDFSIRADSTPDSICDNIADMIKSSEK
jgi:shikimate kinase